jgi:hypothetical protein
MIKVRQVDNLAHGWPRKRVGSLRVLSLAFSLANGHRTAHLRRFFRAGQPAPKKKVKDCSIGYLHVDFAGVRTPEGRQYLCAATDCTKRLRGLTPPEFVCVQWQKAPAIFSCDPTQLTMGLYS